MQQPNPQPSSTSAASTEHHSALFARLVLQLADLAMVMMGRVPNPQTGQPHRDFEAAQMFIDQLDMLEVKTRGNLLPEESRLLRETLMQLRLAFVEAVEEVPSSTEARSASDTPSTAPPQPGPAAPATASASSTPQQPTQAPETQEAETESRRRFFKKYDV